jgi:EmrB/QacA subfamily drug resistance transporter
MGDPVIIMMRSTADNKWLVFSLVAVGVFMSTLDGSIVNIALPAIMEDLKVSLSTIEWVPIIYLLTVSSLLLAFGRLSDIKGRRYVYCGGFFIFSLGSLLCGLARNAAWLIAARSFQGIGAAMIMACSPALVVDVFPPSQRGKGLGMVGTVVAAGLTTGPAIGGLLVEAFSWRVIFYINIPIGIVMTALAAWILKGGKGDVSRAESFDWGGAVLLALCFSSALITVTHGYDWGYMSARTLLFSGCAVVGTILLFLVETRTPHPIFELSLLRIRLFILPVLAAIILFITLFIMIFLMPFFLVQPSGFSMDHAGFMMVIPFVFLFFMSPISGTLYDRIGSRVLCTVGMAVLTIAFYCLSRLTPTSSPIPIAWRLALVGIGVAIFISPNSSAAMSAVPPSRRGVAAATVAAARNLGMVTGVAMAGLIFNVTFFTLSGGLTLKVYRPELEPFFVAAFQKAMFAGSVVSGIGIFVAFFRGSESGNLMAEGGVLGAPGTEPPGRC